VKQHCRKNRKISKIQDGVLS